VSTLEGEVAEGQERERLLAQNTAFLLATCALYAERFVPV